LPAGRSHHLATELLASDRMERLVDDVVRRYDDRLIIIDSPPVLMSSIPGVLALHVGNFWRKFCAAVGREDLITNPKFKTTADRHANRDELIGIIGDILQEKTVAEWQAILDEGDVPNGPVNDVAQALKQPVIRDRNMIRPTQHPVAGRVDVVGTPIHYVGRFEDAPTAAAPTSYS